MARHGLAWRGRARQAWPGVALQGTAGHSLGRRGIAGQVWARRGAAWQAGLKPSDRPSITFGPLPHRSRRENPAVSFFDRLDEGLQDSNPGQPLAMLAAMRKPADQKHSNPGDLTEPKSWWGGGYQ